MTRQKRAERCDGSSQTAKKVAEDSMGRRASCLYLGFMGNPWDKKEHR